MMAHITSPQSFELLLLALLALNTLHVTLRAVHPVAPPWPRQFEPPPRRAGHCVPRLLPRWHHYETRPGQTATGRYRSGAIRPGGRSTQGRAEARRRGRRGGVSWSRHGDADNERLIVGHLNVYTVAEAEASRSSR